MSRSAIGLLWCCLWASALSGCTGSAPSATHAAISLQADGTYHVSAGQSIQAALDLAAKDPRHKTVRVHAGTYRPQAAGQALVWFNRHHDGVTLEADGQVILTAANEALADKSAKSYPAIVNHVVLFGDGITERTVLRGFTLTGANHFVSRTEGVQSVPPDSESPGLEKDLFYYADGGGIKIFGRSSPTILNLTIADNYVSPCGGGISIDQREYGDRPVAISNCIFRNNRCQITGSAIDVLPGSSAVISNCLFVENVANTGPNYVGGADAPYNEEHGSGALTVFPQATVRVDRCTFTGNWNGADDKGAGNVYTRTIFWSNARAGGISPLARYELDILDGRDVTDCLFGGEINDLRGTISETANAFAPPDPDFDELFRPRTSVYDNAGYRPVSSE